MKFIRLLLLVALVSFSFGAFGQILTEDFESGFSNFTNDASNNLNWAINTSYYHGGTQCAHNAHGSSQTNIIYQTTAVDLSSTTAPVLTFWHIAKTEGTYDKCYVEISTDGGTTYTAIPNSAYQGSSADYSSKVYFHEDSYSAWGTSTQTPVNTTWWKEETFSLASYKVANVKIRFRLNSDGSTNRAGWYVDDVVINDITCPTPTSLSASSITATSASLDWTAGGSETGWAIAVQAAGTGTPAGSGTATTNNPYSATGLTANTAYEYYVRADCGGSDYSDWAGPYSFTTACVSVSTFNENFDGVSTPNLPSCWTALLENVSVSSYIKTATSADNTAPNGIEMYSSYGDISTDNIILVSPIVSNLSAGTHRLRFYAKNSSSALEVEVGTITDPNDGTTFTSLQTVDINTTYTEYAVDFSGYAGADNYIAIRRQIPYSTTYDYVYLDDIVWEALPSGPPSCSAITYPSDGATSISITANLSWAANIDATGYKLKIGTTNGGSEFLALTDVGNVTSYNPADEFAYGITYYVTLVPYNANGDAIGCTSTSFTATGGCRTASTPADSDTDISIISSVSWSSLFGSSGYKISIGTSAGGTDILNAHDNGTATSYDLSNLSLAYSTTYHITIAAYNAQGVTAFGCTSTSFTTQADPTVTAPWSDDFESHSATTNSNISTNSWSSNPSGTISSFRWDIDASGSTPTSSTGPNAANSGSKYAYTESSSGSTGNEATLTTPPIDVSGLSGTPTLLFYYHMYGSTMGTLNVDVYDGTSWNSAVWSQTGQQQTSGADAWTVVSVDLSAYVGSGTIQVRFRGVKGSGITGDISIDDVEVKGVVADDVEVVEVTPPSNGCGLTSNESVTVTIKNSGTNSISAGTVSVALTGANNTPSAIVNVGSIAALGTEIITITGVDLSVSQVYNLTATATFSGDGIAGNNTASASVTKDPANTTYPFMEDFESDNGGWTASGANSSWAWGAPSNTVINGASSGTNAWVTNLSGNYNNNELSYLTSSCFDLSGAPGYTLSFKMIRELEGCCDEVWIEYSLDETTWTKLGTNSSGGTNWYNDASNWWDIDVTTWTTTSHDISTLAGNSGVKFRFVFSSDNSTMKEGIGIDDFSITAITCPAPTTLTATAITVASADLGWTEIGTATTWDIEWGATGFTQGAGTMATGTTSNPHNLSGLSANTTYDFYVRSDCGGGDYSDWTGPFSFTTLCDVEIPTYTEDFTTWLNPCWEEARGPISGPTSTGTSNWDADGFLNSGTTGSAKINIYNSGDNEWLISPTFDLSAGGYEINVDVGVTYYSSTVSDVIRSDDAVYLMQSIDGGTTWTTIYTWNNANSPSNTGDNISINVSGVTSVTTQFAFFMLEGSTSSGDINFYVDNFTVQTAPACPKPTTLTATNITGTAADLGWTAGGGVNEADWNIEYGATGFTQGTGTTVTALATNSYALTGLTGLTAYDFYVQANCGATDGNSTWAGPYSFTTAHPNDECATAIELTIASNTDHGNTNSATASADATSCSGTEDDDVWYTFTPELGGSVTITVSPSGSDALSDAALQLMSGACGSLSHENCRDGSGGLNDEVLTFTATAGMTYFVRVYSYSSGSSYKGEFDITVDFPPCPATSVTAAVPHNAGTVAADMECTDANGWTHYWNAASNQMVLSIKKNGNNIGTIGDGTFAVSTTDNGSASFYADGTGFINSGVGGVLMNRKWEVTPTTAPSSNVDVRFYYTAQNYTDVNTEITNQGGTALSAHTDLNFFKVTSGEDPFVVADLSGSDIELILNGVSAGINTWTAGTFGSDFYAEYQVAGFSGGGGGGASGGVALPVELTKFIATQEGTTNVLNWETASEENNSHFEVQRSTNGLEFETIGTIEGNGTTAETSNYHFVDEKPMAVSYYRLRQVDFDGKANLSPVVVVERNRVGNKEANFYPIPVKDRLTVDYNATTDESMTIVVTDVTGRQVFTMQANATQGSNLFFVNFDDLPAGAYFVKLQSRSSFVVRSIIKE